MKNCQEELLYAWIEMSVSIRGNRLLSALSFNEIMICGLIYRQSEIGGMLTATDLCEQTRLLKSQVNRILNSMEEKGMIERIRSTEDKRKVYIRLKEESVEKYLSEHARVMKIMDTFLQEMGEEKMEQLTALIKEAIRIVDRYQKKTSPISDG